MKKDYNHGNLPEYLIHSFKANPKVGSVKGLQTHNPTERTTSMNILFPSS
jgi:hypothetical protein